MELDTIIYIFEGWEFNCLIGIVFLLDDDIPWSLIVLFDRYYPEDKDSYGMSAPLL